MFNTKLVHCVFVHLAITVAQADHFASVTKIPRCDILNRSTDIALFLWRFRKRSAVLPFLDTNAERHLVEFSIYIVLFLRRFQVHAAKQRIKRVNVFINWFALRTVACNNGFEQANLSVQRTLTRVNDLPVASPILIATLQLKVKVWSITGTPEINKGLVNVYLGNIFRLCNI